MKTKIEYHTTTQTDDDLLEQIYITSHHLIKNEVPQKEYEGHLADIYDSIMILIKNRRGNE